MKTLSLDTYGKCEYFLSEFILKENTAGNKARVDAAEIFKKNGINELIYERIRPKKKKTFVYRALRAIDYLLGKRKMDSLSGVKVYVQYPFNVIPRMLPSYRRMLEKNNIIYLVHDVDSIRMKKGEQEIKKEIDELNKAYAVILHNTEMIDFLQKRGLRCNVFNLGIFDYLNKAANKQCHSFDNLSVTFAGNLDKSGFLLEWVLMKRSYSIELYGPLTQDKQKVLQQNDNVDYYGSLSPDVVAEKIAGSFGLVWDGTSVETCNGNYGEYLKINDPHKFSLYVAAGIPVIVWSKSALAAFVREYKIGICVENLHEIQNIKTNMSNGEYDKMLCNLKVIQERVTSGDFLSSCIDKIRNLDK